MIQQMPDNTIALTEAADQESIDMQTASALVQTIRPGELLNTPAAALIHQLFHEYAVLKHVERVVHYQCSCSSERMQNALIGLGIEEIQAIATKTPAIEMNCHFCGVNRVFDAAALIATLRV